MRHLKLIASIFVVCAFVSNAFGANEQPEKTPEQASEFKPVASGKDEKTKTIHFTMADPTQDGEPIQVEYQIDPAKVNDIPTLRAELTEKQVEAAKRVEFLRVQMKLPAEMPDENVMALFMFSSEATQKELDKQYQQKSDSKGKLFKQSLKQTIGMGQHGWASQTILFGVAQGAVIYSICLKEYAYNPACMEQLVQGIKDPIGQMAFASFIVANGFTTSLMNQKYGGVADPKNRAWWDKRPNPSAMRAAIPYIGMSAGMLTSNFSAELLNMMWTCGKILLSQNPGANVDSGASLAAGKIVKKDPKSKQDDPCNMAQKEFFNFENKVEQYLPMLLSMASTTWLLVKAGSGVQKAKWLTSAAVNSDFSKKAAGTKVMKYVAKGTKPMIRMIGLRLAAHVTPAGWVLDGMTVASVAMNILQNTGFLYLDHKFLPILNAGWGQIWRAKLVDNTEDDLKEFFLFNQANGWDKEKNYKANTGVHNRSPYRSKNILPVIKEFSIQMEAWRMINHSKVLMGLQTWAEITNNLIREMNASETFYRYYVDRVFDFFKFSEKSQTPEGISGSEIVTASYIAFRAFPLYGIKPTGHAECAEGIDPDACVSELELYQTYPADMEQFQLRTIKEVVGRFEGTVLSGLKPGVLKPETEKEIKSILADLKSIDSMVVGKALYKINMAVMTNSLNDQTAIILLATLRQALGDPRPVFEQGLMLPALYEASMSQTKIFEGLEDKSGTWRYTFSSYIEYLLYQMICGPDSKDNAAIFKETFGFKPQYNPPRITTVKDATVEWPRAFLLSAVKQGNKPQAVTNLCDPNAGTPFGVLYQSKVFADGKRDGIPFMEFLGKHVRPDIIGDWTNTNHSSTSGFQAWWNASLKEVLYKLFARMDVEFQNLLVGMAEAVNSENLGDGLFNGTMKKIFGYGTVVDPNGILKWTKAKRSLFGSHNQEINVYLTILGEIENLTDSKTFMNTKARFGSEMTLLQQMDRPVYPRTESQKDLVAELLKVTTAVSGLKVINKRATLPVSMKDFNTAYDNMVAQMAIYKTNLDKLPLNTYQKEIVTEAYEHLNKSALQLGVYVFNTQLTNFSASADYKTFLQNSNRVMDSMKAKSNIKQGNNPYGH